jgi:predicted nucleotidyltransferase
MDKAQVIATLRRHRAELQRRGVRHAALFGSLARNEAAPDSDIDIMIDIAPEQWLAMSIYDYVDVKQFVGELFDDRVDVVNKEGLKPRVKPAVLADAIYAF